MVSITLAVPEETKKIMEQHPEMNWSGFIRKIIQEKTKRLEWKEKMLKQLKEEEQLTRWAVSIQRKSRKERLKELERKGLI